MFMNTSEQQERLKSLVAKAAARRALIPQLSRDERPRAFAGRPGDGYTYLIHRDTHPSHLGRWRVTYLQPLIPYPEYRGPAQLTPCGHVCAKTYADALREADSLGADLSGEVPTNGSES
jgi:hypothetical protein